MSYVLIVGAKSDIAKAIAWVYARHGYDLYLAARNAGELQAFAGDITEKLQRTVKLLELDILNYENHQEFYEQLAEKPLGVISAVGYLGNQEKAQTDHREAKLIMDTNYTGVVSLFNIIANDFEQRHSGFIVGISSVAGDRGRKRNYYYGAAKAALTAYLSGLRNRLYDTQVHVLTVKPGFVATKMTEDMSLIERLTAQPDEVAVDIFNAQQNNRNVLYTKRLWRWVMLMIRLIPEWKFKRLNI